MAKKWIDADALTKKLSDFVRPSNNSDFAKVPRWNDAVAIIESMPTADVAPVRHGRWIRLDKDNMFFVPHMLKCSVCGNTLDKHGVNAGRGDANYCPNCGAQMGGWE